MGLENSQGLGRISYTNSGAMNSNISKSNMHNRTGKMLLLLPVACLVVLVLLVCVAVDMVAGPTDNQMKRTAERYRKILSEVDDGTVKKSDIKWISKCYPENCILGNLNDGEWEKVLKNIKASVKENEKTHLQYGAVTAVEESELERYAARISMMEGMQREDVKVTEGNWITYSLVLKESNLVFEDVYEILVLECNGKLGVWASGTKELGYTYMWEEEF